MCSKIYSFIKRGNYLIDLFKCEQETTQGCNQSPALFKVYINDIHDILNKSECDPVTINEQPIGCLTYADDNVVLSASERGLQTSLNNLNKILLVVASPY